MQNKKIEIFSSTNRTTRIYFKIGNTKYVREIDENDNPEITVSSVDENQFKEIFGLNAVDNLKTNFLIEYEDEESGSC